MVLPLLISTASTERKGGHRNYNVAIMLPKSVKPFRLSRKLKAWAAKNHNDPIRRIISVTPHAVEEALCITLDSKDGLYITDDFIVTHNSSLCELRLAVVHGESALRNSPHDLRDWYSSITNSGGMHITDNVRVPKTDVRQRLSDEMCRIVTEPKPHIELRKLYTTSDIWRMPVDVVFGITSIEHPFPYPDIIQRSAIFELESRDENYSGDWVRSQLQMFGGRTMWLAQHFIILHRFMKAVLYDGVWDTEYVASHRLAHYEQTLMVMADVLRLDLAWVQNTLTQNMNAMMVRANSVLEGLQLFAKDRAFTAKPASIRKEPFFVADIAEWANSSDEFQSEPTLTNSRKLGHYITSHRTQVKSACGFFEHDSYGNRKRYILDLKHFGDEAL